MGSIILAIPNLQNLQKISEALTRRGLAPDAACNLGAEVLRTAGSLDFGVVICARKLKDMSYPELFEYLPEHFQLLLLSGDEGYYSPRDGLVRLPPPFSAADLINTVEMMLSNLESTVKRNRKPQRSLEEKKIIDKAKFLLMDRNDMTEPEAYRYIQKTCMDTGRTMLETAEMILMLKS